MVRPRYETARKTATVAQARTWGKAVRLRFELRDADLYAFQFVPYAPEPVRPDLTAK